MIFIWNKHHWSIRLGLYSQRFLFLEVVLFLEFLLEFSLFVEKNYKIFFSYSHWFLSHLFLEFL